MTRPPHTLGRYFVPGSNFVRRLYEKAAREERKNGVVLAPRKFLKFMHSGTSENAFFKMRFNEPMHKGLVS